MTDLRPGEDRRVDAQAGGADPGTREGHAEARDVGLGPDLVQAVRQASVRTAVLRSRLEEARVVHSSGIRELHRNRSHAREALALLQRLARELQAAKRADAGAGSTTYAAHPPADRHRHLGAMHAAYADSRDPALRAELLEAYDAFAVGLVRSFSSRRESQEDLAQVARIGLLHAIDRFDPSMQRPFTTFARATILGELKRHVRDRTWSMRVPRSLQEQYLVVVRAVDDLTQELGRSPRIPEVARRAGVSEDDVLEAMELGGAQRPLSLDVPVGDGDGRTLDPGDHDASLGRVESRALIDSLMARLPDREQHILRLRFVDEMTQAEIAAQIGVSQMYISRLLTRTLARMRTWAQMT